MKKLVMAVLLVIVLLSLFIGVASATCPEYEDSLGRSPSLGGVPAPFFAPAAASASAGMAMLPGPAD